MSNNYTSERAKQYSLKLRQLIDELPPACDEYFRSKQATTSILTRYGYALDLRLFFKFLMNTELCNGLKSMRSINYNILGMVRAEHIERFIEYIDFYPNEAKDDEYIANSDRGKARKLSALRSFYKYLYKKGRISNNAPALVDTPKLHAKPIIRLEPDEIAKLLDAAESGSGLTDSQKRFHALTKLRDAAILTLFLGTGMRISELVGINISYLNFMSNEVRITRKGGSQDILVFGPEVRSALLNYMLQRENMNAAEGSEDALFLSIQRKRMSVRSIEMLVSKYASLAAPLKHISPHKLRSTYGTMLYRETGDIYLVADVLGHKDVNTTKKHYAALSEDRRRTAAEVIRLRNDEVQQNNALDTAENDDGFKLN